MTEYEKYAEWKQPAAASNESGKKNNILRNGLVGAGVAIPAAALAIAARKKVSPMLSGAGKSLHGMFKPKPSIATHDPRYASLVDGIEAEHKKRYLAYSLENLLTQHDVPWKHHEQYRNIYGKEFSRPHIKWHPVYDNPVNDWLQVDGLDHELHKRLSAAGARTDYGDHTSNFDWHLYNNSKKEARRILEQDGLITN